MVSSMERAVRTINLFLMTMVHALFVVRTLMNHARMKIKKQTSMVSYKFEILNNSHYSVLGEIRTFEIWTL